MEQQTEVAKSIGREISPHRRAFRRGLFFTILIMVGVAMSYTPNEPVWNVLITIIGLNTIILWTYAEEAVAKWHDTTN